MTGPSACRLGEGLGIASASRLAPAPLLLACLPPYISGMVRETVWASCAVPPPVQGSPRRPLNHRLVNPNWGPRVMSASVLTDIIIIFVRNILRRAQRAGRRSCLDRFLTCQSFARSRAAVASLFVPTYLRLNACAILAERELHPRYWSRHSSVQHAARAAGSRCPDALVRT